MNELVPTKDLQEQADRDMMLTQDRADRLVSAITGCLMGAIEESTHRFEEALRSTSLRADMITKAALEKQKLEFEKRERERMMQRMDEFRQMLKDVSQRKITLLGERKDATGAEAQMLDFQISLLTAQEQDILTLAGAKPEVARKAVQKEDVDYWQDEKGGRRVNGRK